MSNIKGPGQAQAYDASTLRIGILHSRWNAPIISALVSGARSTLLSAGVLPANITTQSVPGSYELPYGVLQMHTSSTKSSGVAENTNTTTTTTSAASTLVHAATHLLDDVATAEATPTLASTTTLAPFDAIIAIGVLIKGSTMHFEYIADAVSHGLMKVALEARVPVIFGLLTCLTEEQAYTRAGLAHPDRKVRGEGETVAYGEQGHNHGEDWGKAAVEMAVKGRGWGEGVFVQ